MLQLRPNYILMLAFGRRRWSRLFSIMLFLIVGLTIRSVRAAPNPQLVRFATSDGVALVAQIYANSIREKKNSTVVLLHMLSRSSQDYQPLINPLSEKNLNVVTVDFRGHGQSTKRKDGTDIDYHSFTNTDWSKLPEDINTVLDKLPKELKQHDIYLVGASIGANTAALVAPLQSRVKKIVLLSPGINYRGLAPESALKLFTGRSFLVAAEDDQRAASSVSFFKHLVGSQGKTIIYPAGGHGTDLFVSHPALLSEITSWLTQIPQLK